MSHVQWGDVPTWVGAVATLAAAIGAFIAARIAFNQLKEQRAVIEQQGAEQQRIAVLQQMQIEQLDVDAQDRRRSQASQVYLSCVPSDVPGGRYALDTVWTNASPLPVYDIVVTWHVGSAPLGDPATRQVMMPTEQQNELPISSEGIDPKLVGVTLAFRDAAGVRWRTNLKGQLEEIAAP